MRITFWVSAVIILYVYLGYPLLLVAWSRLARRPVRKREWEPTVTVVIAAHDEAGHIGAKLDNCLALEYPPAKLRVVVALDGPSDGTDRIVRSRAAREPRIGVCGSSLRAGKAAALNRAIARARGEVVIFTDARQMLHPGAVRCLLASLSDPSVGSVSGELVLLDEEGREAGEGVGLYWRYEKALRKMESEVHSMLGATGALYAVRRADLSPLPEATILDDMLIPLRAVLRGKRALFEPRARAYDRVSPPEWEYRRKVRTLMGNYQLLRLMPELLSPGRNPVFVQLMSHKVGRLLVPHCLVALYVSSAILGDGLYAVAFHAQTLWYGLALAALVVIRKEGETP